MRRAGAGALRLGDGAVTRSVPPAAAQEKAGPKAGLRFMATGGGQRPRMPPMIAPPMIEPMAAAPALLPASSLRVRTRP